MGKGNTLTNFPCRWDNQRRFVLTSSELAGSDKRKFDALMDDLP